MHVTHITRSGLKPMQHLYDEAQRERKKFLIFRFFPQDPQLKSPSTSDNLQPSTSTPSEFMPCIYPQPPTSTSADFMPPSNCHRSLREDD
ncbi:hypothetical protein SK128_022186, partial [Halocaridina rubra]